MANINLRPSGIDWENKEILFQGYALRDKQGNKVESESDRARQALVIHDSSVGCLGMDITFTDDYVSFVPVVVYNGRVRYSSQYGNNFESFIAPELTYQIRCSLFKQEELDKLEGAVTMETRIYKNHKIVSIFKYKDTFFCPTTPLDTADDLISNLNAENITAFFVIDCEVVNTEDEVKAHATSITKAHRTLNKYIFANNSNTCYPTYSILRDRSNDTGEGVLNHIERGYSYYSGDDCSFDNHLRVKFSEFFGKQLPTDDPDSLMKGFDDVENACIKHVSLNIDTELETINITTNENLYDVKVERQGNFILFTQKLESRTRTIVFNVKDKTCFKSNYNGQRTSYNVANDQDYFDADTHYNYDTEAYVSTPHSIIFSGDKKEIFKGTIIEYLLNLTEEKKNLTTLFTRDKEKPITMKKIVDETSIDTINLLVSILVCGKYKFYEQLATAQMPNLFLWFIDCKRNKSPIKDFWLHCYNEKGSNLKDALGMNMGQLRALDKYLEITADTPASNRSYGKAYQIPYINFWFAENLGLPVDHNTDVDTVVEVAKLFNRCLSYETRYERPAIKSLLEQMKYKDRVAYLKKYAPNLDGDQLESLNDYLNMRNKLAALNVSLAGFPVKPGPAKKFIPLMIGQRFGYRRVRDAEDFEYVIDNEFNDRWSHYMTRDDYDAGVKVAEFVRAQDGKITGALLTLTSTQHVRFLHDEITKLYELHQDESKQTEFAKAIEKVKKFEFKDEEMGLEIIAPKHVTDIRKEGEMLNHCVASYIDPICEGTENIMFIRRTENPDIPYFTLDIVDENNSKQEITKGEVRQVHCYGNGNPTAEGIQEAYKQSGSLVYDQPKDIVKFLMKWAAKMKIIDIKSIKTQYGCLCANKE